MTVTNCQLCDSDKLDLVIDLGLHPLADTFWKAEDLSREEKRYLLQVLLCAGCGYAGLSEIVPAEERYTATDYSYTSSNSPVAVQHFAELASAVAARRKLAPKDLVVDIGSNDGTLLLAFQKEAGCRILGVDPSPNIARLAQERGAPTLAKFFDAAAVDEILENYGQPALICGTNVLNHASDLSDFMANIAKLVGEQGLAVFEVPYLPTLVATRAFDTIYLEHVSYFALRPLRAFFKKFGLVITHAEKIDYMGGSIRLFVGRGAESPAAAKLAGAEESAGIFRPETYKEFMKDIEGMKSRVLKEIEAVRARGEKIVGIGAATKGNTFLNYCGIDSGMLEFITDESPLKIGKYTPGSRIFIKGNDDIITPEIHYALILPWNIAGFLTEKLKDKNLQFITPGI